MAAALELARTAPRGRKRAREGGEHSDKMAKLEDDAASRLAGDCLERSAALDAWSTPLSVNSSGGGGGEGRGGVCGQKGQPVRCRSEFFNQSCTELARSMLDCVLVSAGESGEVCRGRVVETEAYLGGEDKASHSYNGRRSRANEAMFMVRGGERWREVTSTHTTRTHTHYTCTHTHTTRTHTQTTHARTHTHILHAHTHYTHAHTYTHYTHTHTTRTHTLHAHTHTHTHTGSRHSLCVLHIWHAQLLQRVQPWGWGSCACTCPRANQWTGGDEEEGEGGKERHTQRRRVM